MTRRASRLHSGVAGQSRLVMDHPSTEPSAQKSNVTSDEFLRRVLATICSWILQKLTSLQDELLSFAIFRKAAAYGLAPRCNHIVLQAVQKPDKINNSFEDLEYYVSEDARELLMHAGLHGLVASSTRGLQQSSVQLPNLGRILLQTPIKNSSLYQEAVAGALAKRLNADFLVVDDVLLSSVARAAFGSSIHKPEHQEDLGKLLHFVLSIWFSGKPAFPALPHLNSVHDILSCCLEGTFCAGIRHMVLCPQVASSVLYGTLSSAPVAL